jgi:hypothetical protein
VTRFADDIYRAQDTMERILTAADDIAGSW